MRKKLFAIIAFLFMLPLGIALTACGGGQSNSGVFNRILLIYGDKDGTKDSSYASQEEYCLDYYGLSFSDIQNDTRFFIEYKDGKKKELNEANFSQKELEDFERDASVKHYSGHSQTDDGQGHITPEEWNEMEDVNRRLPLNVGEYKIVYTLRGTKASIRINIMAVSNYEKNNIKIAVVQNDVTNYSAYYNNSSYKFGCPEYKECFDEDTYTSNYKVYVYDNDEHEVVSGTKVNEVRAMPKYAPEDYTFEWYDVYGGQFEVAQGDDLLTKYNEIAAPNAPEITEEIAAYIRKERRNTFLYHYSDRITTGKVRDDSTLVVYTENIQLAPGQYYVFAQYQDNNHTAIFTTPTSTLTIQKGDFIWRNTIHLEGEDYDANLVDEILDSLTNSMIYTFDGQLFNNGVQKALTLDNLKGLSIQTESTHADYSRINCTMFGGGRSGLFGWGNLVLNGKDENGNNVSRFDSTDNGIVLQAQFKVDEYSLAEFEKYYATEDNTTIFYVDVEINRGSVSAPSVNGSTFTFDNQEHFLIVDVESQYFNITGTTTAQTAVGNYHTTYTLKDSTNYYVYGTDAYITGQQFDWEIVKINFEECYFEKNYTYNGNTSENYEITYIPGAQNRIVVALSNQIYNFVKSLYPSTTIQFALTESGDFVDAAIDQTGLDDGEFAFTFTGSTSDYTYANISITIAQTAVSLEYTPINPVQIVMHKYEYTDSELAEIYGNWFVESTDEFQNKTYVAANNVSVSELTRLVPAEADPAHDTTVSGVTTTLGHWAVYYYNGNGYVLTTPGTTVLPSELGNIWWLYYRFIPNDAMYQSLNEIAVEIDWHKEDLPSGVITALGTEVSYTQDSNGYHASGSFETITLTTQSNCVYVPNNTLPTHDPEGEGFEGIDGSWCLLYDYEDENGNPQEMTVGNNQCLYYEVNSEMQYSVRSRDYMASADRNWRIMFRPTNSAYNPFIMSVNVVVPELP